ncbi:hypothetical protein IMZ38_02235 [Thermosphaera chiliense]|uniref:Uncharacterized protein n=1 Tax=Thermosphaera chiliense TaxID=3402707 RepID=A0A7M1US25_9CREN|nr:hypothetical protein [Thermosphaera aggregans]QOR94769.1 hypothetical protein IMZ38_02235 [Thermosphaera aggregans]
MFCKFLNNVLWDAIISKIRNRLKEVGFDEVYVVDETMRSNFSLPQY